MRPRLLPVSGKHKGTVFAMSEKETTIGRDGSNDVCLDEQSVSRQHCVIRQTKNGRFFIRDLDSYNGVFVNGIPTENHEIKHGNQIGIGNVVLFFLTEENEASLQEARVTVMEDGNLNDQSTIRLKRKDLTYLSPEILAAELPQFTRIAADFSSLLQIASTLNSIQDFDLLQQRLLELVGDVIPADRSAVIIADQADTEYATFYTWNREYREITNIGISGTVLSYCLEERLSVLCSDVTQDTQFAATESLTAASVASVLCVPLLVFDRVIGVLYADTSKVDRCFDENHLQLLTCIAEIAARPLESARQIETLRSENQRLFEQLDENRKIIGESKKIKDVFRIISRVAPVETTVLVLGESGTGKELAARAIHQNSSRKDNPFISINCATLTENLLESELFGHEKGAFTGAATIKIGQFELADRGTIFLDEIGELSLHLQAKLLRVLQEREVTRLGALRPRKIDVRIVAATNRDLEECISEGSFRDDLYYRLNVIGITMPPLRDRREDIPILSRYFINKYNNRCKRNIKGIETDAKSYLQEYSWNGNVRELENVIERAVILARGDTITIDDLPEAIVSQIGLGNNHHPETDRTFRSAVKNAKRKIIQSALAEAEGSVSAAARILAIHPNNLHRLMREFGSLPDTKI